MNPSAELTASRLRWALPALAAIAVALLLISRLLQSNTVPIEGVSIEEPGQSIHVAGGPCGSTLTVDSDTLVGTTLHLSIVATGSGSEEACTSGVVVDLNGRQISAVFDTTTGETFDLIPE